jgi:hypothetical protein
VITHIVWGDDSQDPEDVIDALLYCMVVQRRVVAPVAEVPVLGYAIAEVYGLADVEAGLFVEA